MLTGVASSSQFIAHAPPRPQAIDIWMAMCIWMVFGAMVEFAIVNTNARKEMRELCHRYGRGHVHRAA